MFCFLPKKLGICTSHFSGYVFIGTFHFLFSCFGHLPASFFCFQSTRIHSVPFSLCLGCCNNLSDLFFSFHYICLRSLFQANESSSVYKIFTVFIYLVPPSYSIFREDISFSFFFFKGGYFLKKKSLYDSYHSG